jgi:hypothetical protein
VTAFIFPILLLIWKKIQQLKVVFRGKTGKIKPVLFYSFYAWLEKKFVVVFRGKTDKKKKKTCLIIKKLAEFQENSVLLSKACASGKGRVQGQVTSEKIGGGEGRGLGDTTQGCYVRI